MESCVVGIRVAVPSTLPLFAVREAFDIVHREVLAHVPANIQTGSLDRGRVSIRVKQCTEQVRLVAVRLELGRGD